MVEGPLKTNLPCTSESRLEEGDDSWGLLLVLISPSRVPPGPGRSRVVEARTVMSDGVSRRTDDTTVTTGPTPLSRGEGRRRTVRETDREDLHHPMCIALQTVTLVKIHVLLTVIRVSATTCRVEVLKKRTF